MMKFLFGLGNPGQKYQQTRHNAGFLFADFLLAEFNGTSLSFSLKSKLETKLIKHGNLVIAKPQTYMNHSGRAVQKTINYWSEIEQVVQEQGLVVVHDDLDIKLGQCKLQFGTGPKKHNGLESVYRHLGTDQFWHLRLGVDTRQGERVVPADKYVLGKLSSVELDRLSAQFIQAKAQLEQKELITL